jgi:hypothetical protein
MANGWDNRAPIAANPTNPEVALGERPTLRLLASLLPIYRIDEQSSGRIPAFVALCKALRDRMRSHGSHTQSNRPD